jgi:hypothetical protein
MKEHYELSNKAVSFEDFKKEALKDSENQKEYEFLNPEY